MLALAGDAIGVLAGAALWGLHMALTQGLLAALVAATAPGESARNGVRRLQSRDCGVALLVASVLAGWLWERSARRRRSRRRRRSPRSRGCAGARRAAAPASTAGIDRARHAIARWRKLSTGVDPDDSAAVGMRRSRADASDAREEIAG